MHKPEIGVQVYFFNSGADKCPTEDENVADTFIASLFRYLSIHYMDGDMICEDMTVCYSQTQILIEGIRPITTLRGVIDGLPLALLDDASIFQSMICFRFPIRQIHLF